MHHLINLQHANRPSANRRIELATTPKNRVKAIFTSENIAQSHKDTNQCIGSVTTIIEVRLLARLNQLCQPSNKFLNVDGRGRLKNKS